MKKIFVLFLFLVFPPACFSQGKAAFTCKHVPRENYTIQGDRLDIAYKGTTSSVTFQKETLPAKLKPFNMGDVFMTHRLLLSDKNSTFVDILFVGEDNELYACFGGSCLGTAAETQAPFPHFRRA